jgi:anti-sigma28 factor (negative regulator of flagellin synthesis)
MKFLLMIAMLMGLGGVAHSDESVGEKIQSSGNDAGRAVKKGAHRVEESACMQSDTECLAKKAKNRGEEGVDSTKDKVKEIKNDIDDDRKK